MEGALIGLPAHCIHGHVWANGTSIKLFLAKHEPLQASTPPRVTSLLQDLQKSREKWAGLLVEKTRPPDEQLADPPSARSLDAARNINLNNPLSQHNEVSS